MRLIDRLALQARIVLALVGLLYIAIPDKLAVVNSLYYGILLLCLAVSG